MIKKYTANYTQTNPNFVIQNLVEDRIDSAYLSVFYVIKNILQRGTPTMLSVHLQQYFGKSLHLQPEFKTPFLLIDTELPVWSDTIKGDKGRNFYPAKIFFEKVIPASFGDYAFVQTLMLPEAGINEIVNEYNEEFINQNVDFFLPQVKMVIEIDGQQHKLDDVTRVKDNIRDQYLLSKGITTFRISVKEVMNGNYGDKVTSIIHFLSQREKKLQPYRYSLQEMRGKEKDEEIVRTKLLPTAVMRFQILVLELLINDYLRLEDKVWKLNIIERDVRGFAAIAIEDLFLWVKNICQLRKLPFNEPVLDITTASPKEQNGYVNIDFSLMKRYTDEHVAESQKIFVRTDYYGAEKNHFVVSTDKAVTYQLINDSEEDKSALRFLLKNIFDKDDFRDGQFPIITNALSRRDTIGLLPTGGGKSLCYQLSCLLQPCISFVVSPIKSLMYDQQDNLKPILISNVNYVTGDLTSEEKAKIQLEFSQGKYLFIWVSPERFQIKSFREYLTAVNANFSIAYAVIDEVHCLSEWGHDFRTSYLNLAKAITKYCSSVVFIGLTATASVHVLKDVKVEFDIKDENVKVPLDYSRKELHFEIIRDDKNKLELLKTKLDDINRESGFIDIGDKAALIFSPNVNGHFGCYELSNYINTLYPDKSKFYSGEVPVIDEYDMNGRRTYRKIPIMPPDEFIKYKNKVQGEFKKNVFPLLTATKAFGMGIDKQNIYYTIHYGIPSSVESLYQEAGRAGRWNKALPENKNKIAKCFVLHSPETVDAELVNEIFLLNTNVARIADINKQVGFDGKDIFRIIFLFLQGHKEMQEDFVIMKFIISTYFREGAVIKIYWREAINRINEHSLQQYEIPLSVKETDIQKLIYKLSILGIVKDWTTDFSTHYEVIFNKLNDDFILDELTKYIRKYDTISNVKEEVMKMSQPIFIDRCIWFLLQWTWDNIVYKRRQSIKTLSDWCTDFDNSENFKERIDSYFRITETTFIIQHIAEYPKEYEKWFQLFYQREKLIRTEEIERLKDSLSRFLESYRSNTGLNVISGLIRLILNDFEDTDGRPRLENAFEQFSHLFSIKEQDRIIERMIGIGLFLSEELRYELAKTIIKFYPGKLEHIADKLDIIYLLNDMLVERIDSFKKFNFHLYEQLTKI